MNDIIETLINNLPSILAGHIIINPNRIEDIRIKYENQTKNSRASAEEIAKEYNNALILLKSTHGNNESCQTIGCLSEDEMDKIFQELENTTEWVYILHVSFVLREGPTNETKTDEAVALMTNWINENCFEFTFEGMEIKFTTLQERNIHTDKQIYDWCKDGDLKIYVTGEFEIINDLRNYSHILIHKLRTVLDGKDDENWELIVWILKTGMVYHPENYVANILFQSNSIDTSLFNVSGEVTICSNRSTLEDCWPQVEVDAGSCEWNEDGSIDFHGGMFGVHQHLKRY